MKQTRNNQITKVSIVGIGANAEVASMREDIRRMAMSQEGVLQMHGFFVDEEEIAFDVVISFDHDAPAICHRLQEQIEEQYPGKKVHITADTSYS